MEENSAPIEASATADSTSKHLRRLPDCIQYPLHTLSRAMEVAKMAHVCLQYALCLVSQLGLGPGLVVLGLRLVLYVMCLLPGLAQVAMWYCSSKELIRDIRYGKKPRQVLDIYLPPNHGKEAKTVPVVIFVTGGAWMIGYKAWGALLARRLSKGGVLVASLDYRNYPLSACSVSDMLDDVSAGITWVLQNLHTYGGNSQKVFLVGQSAGAHLSLLALMEKCKGIANCSVLQDSLSNIKLLEVSGCKAASAVDKMLGLNSCGVESSATTTAAAAKPITTDWNLSHQVAAINAVGCSDQAIHAAATLSVTNGTAATEWHPSHHHAASTGSLCDVIPSLADYTHLQSLEAPVHTTSAALPNSNAKLIKSLSEEHFFVSNTLAAASPSAPVSGSNNGLQDLDGTVDTATDSKDCLQDLEGEVDDGIESSSTDSEIDQLQHAEPSVMNHDWLPSDICGYIGISGVYDLMSIKTFLADYSLKADLVDQIMTHKGRFSMDLYSPVHAIQSMQAKALKHLPKLHILHGDQDKAAPLQGCQAFAAAIAQAGAHTPDVKLYPGQGHTSPLVENPLRGGRDELLDDVLSIVLGKDVCVQQEALCPDWLVNFGTWFCPF